MPVATTGVFCRPSCASRQPLRENVTFFVSSEEARRAGFRPCKRCKPTQARAQDPTIDRVVEACRLIERGEMIRSSEIAGAVGLSAFYFQRVFKKHVGVTPQAYRRRVLAERARGAIRSGRSITAAIYDAGYSSSSRFMTASAVSSG
jgi:AraC family transcriptional regulator of adaptative response/methylated-DNA-[protein]-cysteine methyltransferase